MRTLWSNLCAHYSVTVVLGAPRTAGMDWSGENVGAFRGAAWIGGMEAVAVANVRSADIVFADSVAIYLRKEADLVAVGAHCHGSEAMGDQVRGVLGNADRGGGGRTARIADGIQYITPETKFLHCHGPCLMGSKKRKGAAA